MKKRMTSFFAGMTASALTLTLCTTALAASGQVSFNFAGVSLNGETKIAAGESITAANGQQIPGSILYTDSAGGKTNYLPVRAISELLGVEVGYDAATKTVLLKGRPAERTASRWTMTLEEGHLTFQSEADGAKHDGPPAYRPTWQARGWGLSELRGRSGGSRVYLSGEARITFHCSYPGSSYGYGMFTDPEEAVKTRRQLTVQGCAADLYEEGEERLLVWENGDGILFCLAGRNADDETLIQMAESVRLWDRETPACTPAWLPEGCREFERSAACGAVQTVWMTGGHSLTLLSSADPVAEQTGKAEEAKVNGQAARFWAAAEPAAPGNEPETETVGGVTITSATVSGFGAADMNTLTWSDGKTGMHFLLLSALDRETMLRIAESVR